MTRVYVGNVESRSSVSLEDAVWRLGLAIDKQKDIGITVTYPEGTTVVFIVVTLALHVSVIFTSSVWMGLHNTFFNVSYLENIAYLGDN